MANKIKTEYFTFIGEVNSYMVQARTIDKLIDKLAHTRGSGPVFHKGEIIAYYQCGISAVGVSEIQFRDKLMSFVPKWDGTNYIASDIKIQEESNSFLLSKMTDSVWKV